jgi:hypothetical protein
LTEVRWSSAMAGLSANGKASSAADSRVVRVIETFLLKDWFVSISVDGS